MATSAAAGMPGSPSRVATAPSFMQPGPVSVRSSACTMTGRPRSRAYSSARRITPADITGRPSSVTHAQPASFSSAMSLRASPSDPRVMAPAGSTRANPASRARACTNRATDALSQTGRVFGMATRVVIPPAAAARVPVAMVSFASSPGSRRCTCRSTSPGSTSSPRQSTTSFAARSPADTVCSRTSLILPPSRIKVRIPSTRVAGSTTLPPSRKIMRHRGRARGWPSGPRRRCPPDPSPGCARRPSLRWKAPPRGSPGRDAGPRSAAARAPACAR